MDGAFMQKERSQARWNQKEIITLLCSVADPWLTYDISLRNKSNPDIVTTPLGRNLQLFMAIGGSRNVVRQNQSKPSGEI